MSKDNRLFEYRGHWLVKRSCSPNFYICWRRPEARLVRSRTTGTCHFETAKRRLTEFADGRSLDGLDRPKVQASTTILDVLSVYVDRLKANNQPSHEQAAITLKHWIQFCKQEDVVYVPELTLDVQDRYVAFRRKAIAARGYAGSNGTLIRELGVLASGLELARKRGLIQTVPELERLREPPPRDVILDLPEVQRLFEAARYPYLLWYNALGLHTLQRPTAILQLHIKRVDFRTGLVNFLPLGETQSNKYRPTIPMSATVRSVLETAAGQTKSGYIIERDGAPLTTIRRAFSTNVRDAGLSDDITPYVLRHTGATYLAAAGVPLHLIAVMLGHSNLKTTERYVKRRPDFLAEVVNTTDKLFPMPNSAPAGNCSSVCSSHSEVGTFSHLGPGLVKWPLAAA